MKERRKDRVSIILFLLTSFLTKRDMVTVFVSVSHYLACLLYVILHGYHEKSNWMRRKRRMKMMKI